VAFLHFDGDYSYAYSRVRDCFVWKPEVKELFYVASASNNYRELLLNDKRGNMVISSWEEISFEPPSFRSVNTKNGTIVAERMPLRRDWRQGLRSNQFRIDTFGRADGYNWMQSHWNSVEKAIRKEYPSLEEALWDLEEFSEARAISPHLVIDNEYKLWYLKAFCIGVIDPDDNIVLNKRFRWMQEQVQEEVGENVVFVQETV
jgi:hypothetical protein